MAKHLSDAVLSALPAILPKVNEEGYSEALHTELLELRSKHRSLTDEVTPQTITVTAAYTILNEDRTIFADVAGGDFAVTLPLAADVPDRRYVIKNIHTSGTVTVTVIGGDSIDNGATHDLLTNVAIDVISNGITDWWIT